jgi:butyrate response factor 1
LNAGQNDSSFDNILNHGDRKSHKGIIGLRSNNQLIDSDSNRDTISPSLLTSLLLSAVPSSTLNKNNDPWATKSLTASKVDDSDIEQLQKLRTSGFASNNFSQNQFEHIQKLQQLSFSEKQQQLASLCSGSNDIPSTSDLVYRQEQQQKFNNHSNANQTSFLFDHHDDPSSSASSSTDSSSDSFSSSGANAKVNTSRYKTEMCRPFQENGSCKYGEKCQFAHGFSELRTVTRHPKYKTDLCRTYHASGFCPYGPRCHFVHNLDEASSQQLPVNVILRPGQSSSPSSSSPTSTNSTTEVNKSDGAMRPLPMFSPKRNVAPPKPFIACSNTPFNFELKLNTNTNTSPSYMNVSSGGGSVASLSPATPISLDGISSTSFSGDNARSPNRLPVFSTLHQ